jgi:hypothetical protein
VDGSGYPDRLHSLMIPLGARILALANDYDELQSGALALQRHSPKSAREYIVKQRGKRYDPSVVDAFIALIEGEEWQLGVELSITPAELKPGMVLKQEVAIGEDYQLPAGRVFDADTIAQVLRLQEARPEPITLFVRTGAGPAVPRNRAAPPPRAWKEVALPTARLKDGMKLSRSLYHQDGFLLLGRGNHLDESIIRQLREIEAFFGKPMIVHIRIDER